MARQLQFHQSRKPKGLGRKDISAVPPVECLAEVAPQRLQAADFPCQPVAIKESAAARLLRPASFGLDQLHPVARATLRPPEGCPLYIYLQINNLERLFGFGPLATSGVAAAEEAEKCQALVVPGDKACHLLSASILYTMAYA